MYRYADSASGSQYAPRPYPAVISHQCRTREGISTENNGFAGDERDETLIDENLVETEIPLADRIPGAVRETEEGDRPIYDEEGYRNDPGGE